jgi:hypothetical protein
MKNIVVATAFLIAIAWRMEKKAWNSQSMSHLLPFLDHVTLMKSRILKTLGP